MAVSASDLRKLVDIPLDKSNDDLQIFLDMASLIVAEVLPGTGLTAARLRQIELFLAAHYTVVGLEHGGLQVWQTGTARETYKSVGFNREGLASTHWGQQALALDTTGTLAQTFSTKKAWIQIGKPSYTEDNVR